jgi:hypothetical protein
MEPGIAHIVPRPRPVDTWLREYHDWEADRVLLSKYEAGEDLTDEEERQVEDLEWERSDDEAVELTRWAAQLLAGRGP